MTTSVPSQLQSFSFYDDNQIEIPLDNIHIKEKFTIRIERVSHSIARLVFVKNSEEIDIPEGVEVFDMTNNVVVTPFLDTESYILCWSDNYLLRGFGDTIYLKTDRQWNIHSKHNTPIHSIKTISTHVS
jgi:hypothetical protein